MTQSLLASSDTVGTSALMPIVGVGFWGVKLFQFFSRLVLLIVSVRKSGKGKDTHHSQSQLFPDLSATSAQ